MTFQAGMSVAVMTAGQGEVSRESEQDCLYG